MSKDLVFISGLKVKTVIGVYEWEKEIRQTLLIDLKMANDNRLPAQNDEITKALDYANISARIISFAEEVNFELIETFAERLAALLIEEYSIPWLELTINKPGAVPQAQMVGVQITRSKS